MSRVNFGLIHGGCHSPGSWSHLVPELQARGHDAALVDLPIEDPGADLATYTDVAVKALADADPLVVVGHSLGAATALTAAEQLRPRGVVLLCPAIIFGSSPGAPEPMLTMAPDSTWVDDAGLSHMSDGAGEYWFYPDCAPEIVAEAVAQLRPQGVAGLAGPATAQRTSVPSILIRAEDDRCVAADWQHWAASVLTGGDPVTVPGGHSPFLSRPALLADVLDRFAQQVTPG